HGGHGDADRCVARSDLEGRDRLRDCPRVRAQRRRLQVDRDARRRPGRAVRADGQAGLFHSAFRARVPARVFSLRPDRRAGGQRSDRSDARQLVVPAGAGGPRAADAYARGASRVSCAALRASRDDAPRPRRDHVSGARPRGVGRARVGAAERAARLVARAAACDPNHFRFGNDLLPFPEVNTSTSSAPRILILQSDRRTGTLVREYALKGFRGASVQSTTAALADLTGDGERLKSFDVVLAGCDFSAEGDARGVLDALRAIAADPDNPPIVLLTKGGSEYTAVQAVRAGAFDCVPLHLLGREKLVVAVGDAVAGSAKSQGASSRNGHFGYPRIPCQARLDNAAVRVASCAEPHRTSVVKVLH